MVKIPGLDDLKKMGNDLLDSAKTGMDKIKSGMDAAASKKGISEAAAASDNPLLAMIQEVKALCAELATVQAQEALYVKKIQDQLATIATVAATYQKPAAPEAPPISNENEENKQ